MKNTEKTLNVIYAILIVVSLFGEVKCALKAMRCNWNPIGKAEIVYTVAVFTGAGSFIGWFNIEDE